MALRTLFPGFIGTDGAPDWLARLIDDGLGGVVLFSRNIDPAQGDVGVASLTGKLKAHRPDLLVAIDEEGGDVTRLDAATGSAFPGAAALGSIDDAELTAAVAAELGTRLRNCGIDLNFAPVADVDVDPRNPVIGVRAFGDAPELVARQVSAFVTGQQASGVAATAKHFPGHGGTTEDSHVTIPVLDVTAEMLEARELAPFRAAIAAGVQAVMTAHIIVPVLDPALPVTLSPGAVSQLLRQQLGYDGLVITDGLDMHAISRGVGRADGAVQALIAGSDAICVGGDSTEPEVVDEIVAAIVAAVRSGRMTVARLAEAAGRVARLAEWVRAAGDARSNDAASDGTVSGAALQAARRAVVTKGGIHLPSPPVVLELHEPPSVVTGPVPWSIGAPLAERMPGTDVVSISEDGSVLADVIAHYAHRPVVVSVRDLRRRPWQVAAIAEVRAVRPDAIVVDHGMSGPTAIASPYVRTFGASRVSAAAAADLLAPK